MAGAELAGHGRFYGEDHVPLNLLLSLLVENSTAFLYPDGFYRKALDGLLVTRSLGMSEQHLPPRQVWGRKFIIYGALGIHNADLTGWKLQVDGLVEKPVDSVIRR